MTSKRIVSQIMGAELKPQVQKDVLGLSALLRGGVEVKMMSRQVGRLRLCRPFPGLIGYGRTGVC